MVMGVKTSSQRVKWLTHKNVWSGCVCAMYLFQRSREGRGGEIHWNRDMTTQNYSNHFQHFSSLHKSTFDMKSFLLSGLYCIYYFHYYELWSRPPWDEWQSTMWDWGITGFGICGTICHHHPPHDPKNVCPVKYHYYIPRQNVNGRRRSRYRRQLLDTVETIRTYSEEPLCLCGWVCALLLLPRKVILKEPENRDGWEAKNALGL